MGDDGERSGWEMMVRGVDGRDITNSLTACARMGNRTICYI